MYSNPGIIEEDLDELELERKTEENRKVMDRILDKQISEGARRQRNRIALEKVEKRYGKLRDLEDRDRGRINDMMKDLYMTDFVCIGCGRGHEINYAILKFYNFDESVKCWKCQHQ